MAKAKLSQIASTWIEEEGSSKERSTEKRGRKKVNTDVPKKKQTFNLRVDTIKRLWMERVRTDKPISEIMDALVIKHLPKVEKTK